MNMPRRQVVPSAGLLSLSAVIMAVVGALAGNSSSPPATFEQTTPARAPVVSEAALDGDVNAAEQEKELEQNYPEAMQAIRSQIETLRAESLEESLAALNDVEMFYMAGSAHDAQGYVGEFPLAPEIGREDVLILLSNRRVIKIFQELQAQPTGRASELLTAYIDQHLAEYCELFSDKFSTNERLREVTEGNSTPFSYQISNNSDGTPTLIGSKYAVFSLVFLAGALKAEGAKDAVNRVLDVAVQQRDEMYDFSGRGYDKHKALNVLVRASLYNRQILTVAMAGVAGLNAEQKSSSEDKAVAEGGWTRVTVVPFDALLTPFELPRRQRGGKTDYSKGRFEIPAIGMASDQSFNLTAEAFRKTLLR